MNARDDMNDTDVLNAVRDSLSRVSLTNPPDVEAIMVRGRARRRRRLIPGVTGTVAVAAGAAFAVTALAPAGHQASRPPTVQLAAWSVTRLADGHISVTVRELRDPAGLQSTLRADGVPASVTFTSQHNPACRPYPGGTPQGLPQPATLLLKRVFPKPYNDLPLPPKLPVGMRQARPVHGRPPVPPGPSPDSTLIVINPSALPGNAGVQLGVALNGKAFLLPRVVYASQQCTGS
jgi:hypothetical protein